jgi:hypothetical protein
MTEPKVKKGDSHARFKKAPRVTHYADLRFKSLPI